MALIDIQRTFNYIYKYHKAAYDPEGVVRTYGANSRWLYKYSMVQPLEFAQKVPDTYKQSTLAFLQFAPRVVDKIQDTFAVNLMDKDNKVTPGIPLDKISENYQTLWTLCVDFSRRLEAGEEKPTDPFFKAIKEDKTFQFDNGMYFVELATFCMNEIFEDYEREKDLEGSLERA